MKFLIYWKGLTVSPKPLKTMISLFSGAGGLDIGLAKGAEDDEYLSTLEEALTLSLRQFQPDAIIYDAGVDIHVNDDLGHLHVSTKGVFERDKQVFQLASQLGVPIAAVIGGGYQRNISALVDVHIQLYRAAGVIA